MYKKGKLCFLPKDRNGADFFFSCLNEIYSDSLIFAYKETTALQSKESYYRGEPTRDDKEFLFNHFILWLSKPFHSG